MLKLSAKIRQFFDIRKDFVNYSLVSTILMT